MRQLSLALYAEGSTDGFFLPPIIVRSAQGILSKLDQLGIDVQEPHIQYKNPGGRSILIIAQELAAYDLLVVHSDGDNRGYKKTLDEFFLPAKNLVLTESDKGKSVCVHLVPLIPVRSIEAWMLADPNAVCTVLGIDKKRASTLDLPKKAVLVEKELNPKRTLDLLIEAAYPKQPKSRKKDFKYKLYKELGSEIDLQRLREVDSYKYFEADLTTTLLQALDFIQK